MSSIEFSDSELGRINAWFEQLDNIDLENPEIVKLRAFVWRETEYRKFKKLRRDHRARIDPDYPPNQFLLDE